MWVSMRQLSYWIFRAMTVSIDAKCKVVLDDPPHVVLGSCSRPSRSKGTCMAYEALVSSELTAVSGDRTLICQQLHVNLTAGCNIGCDQADVFP